MLTTSFRRKTLLVLLVTALVTPVLSAAAPQPESPRSVQFAESGPLDILGRAWSFLRKVASKEGCRIDPDGCTSQNPRPQPKEGCHIDPNGRCLS